MTAQISEDLILDDESFGMTCCPTIPEDHPRIAPPDANDWPAPDIVHSSACWREYIGTWAVRDDRLYLLSVVGRYRLIGEEPLLADWFSGTLTVPCGELVQYVHMGFGSVYSSEIHIRVERGAILERRAYNHPGGFIDVDRLMWSSIPGLEDEDEPRGDDW
jgi:hypothetical protein